MKILTLNVWRYYEWDKRKEELIRFLNEQKADLILLQEVALDSRQTGNWKNQADEINKDLKYIGCSYEKMEKMQKWHGKPIDWDMWYGFGILSKWKIKSQEIILLNGVEKDKKFGFMHAKIACPDGDIDVINVHFENTTKGAKEHLRQTLEWCKERNMHPIIAGDFNMKVTEDVIELAQNEYYISYLITKYFSFMPTEFSHDKVPITLDYIIANKKKFIMDKVECAKTASSDHKPVIATIKLI
ncbi:MAG TPA: endonuclease/exonuclease/phosphatase family protein [Candidatus Nanoarchaeia archaeon]|nr:endonuclease/exonuclease/phosphatase family protein [Candidatus Nanoarchaeia archaeon]